MTPISAEQLAQAFHEVYERLSPFYAYESSHVVSISWSELPDRNKQLMIAVCQEIIERHFPTDTCAIESEFGP